MFFPKRIISIHPGDRVLEIGPGAVPHPRSDEFLEIAFTSDREKIAQRGDVIREPRFGKRPVHYYDGLRFPFKSGQFDYVICSHVIEHVSDVRFFMSEVFRTGGGRGYLEYPLITFEYMYDFDVHRQFVKFDPGEQVLRYLPKEKTNLSEFREVAAVLRKTLQYKWDDHCAANKRLFFEGFEFNQVFAVEEAVSITQLVPGEETIKPKSMLRRIFGQVCSRVGL